MNRYTIQVNASPHGDQTAYRIGHMYALWAERYDIPYWFSCHPNTKGVYCLDIELDLSSEIGIHRLCDIPKEEWGEGRRYTSFASFFPEGQTPPSFRANRYVTNFVLNPYVKLVIASGEEFRDKQVFKILDGKIPWLKHLRK